MLSATISSGLRSIYGYCVNGRVESWDPFAMNESFFGDWIMPQIEHLASKAPFGEGRVKLGFSFDGFFIGKDATVQLFEKLKALGVGLITSHYVSLFC